jgi:hypothetical protein
MSYYGGYYGQSYEQRALHFNNDGHVTRSDFYRAAANAHGGYLSHHAAHSASRAFDRFDYNGDGRLDRYECL